MPSHVVELVTQSLSRVGRALHGARILILGVAFKRDVDDARNSPAERVIELLLRRGAEISYHDPYVPRYRVGRDVFLREERWLESVPLADDELLASDCVVILAGHQAVDYARVVRSASLVVDAVNATRNVAGRALVVRVGAAAPDRGPLPQAAPHVP